MIDSRSYWDRFGLQVHAKWDLGVTRRVIVGGDGADWVKEGLSYFPGAQFQLDEYHVRRRVLEAIGDRKSARAVGNGLVEGNWDQVWADAEQAARLHPERGQELVEFCRWAYANRDNALDYRRRAGWLPPNPRGTGAIESNVDKSVANRFKKRGRGWTTNAEVLVREALNLPGRRPRATVSPFRYGASGVTDVVRRLIHQAGLAY